MVKLYDLILKIVKPFKAETNKYEIDSLFTARCFYDPGRFCTKGG